MRVEGSTAFVSGANRGLGRAITLALVDSGASKVYAGARRPGSVTDSGVIPVRLDITRSADIAAAAARCSDVTLLVNNAGIAQLGGVTGPASDTARELMETNYFGTLNMCRLFAPVLAANGGGAVVNILSIVSFMSAPGLALFCATKAALWSLTNGLRMELRSQGSQVLAVHPTFIETDMSASLDVPKLAASVVAAQVLAAVDAGEEELLLGERTRAVKDALPRDLELIYPDIERQGLAYG